MSPPAWYRLAGLCGLALALAALPAWPDAPSPEVDLTLAPSDGPLTNSIGMRFVPIRAGKFLMGAPKGEKPPDSDERPQHEVEITRAFWLGAHEVTQKQYRAVMGKNPSYCSKDGGGKGLVKGLDTDDFPVDNVFDRDALAFIEKLGTLRAEKGAGRTYRLPTRGGVGVRLPRRRAAGEAFHFGKTLGPTQANFGDSSEPVKGGAGPDVPGRVVPAQRLGAVRHARQRLGVGRRLVRQGLLQEQPQARPHGAGQGRPACAARRELARSAGGLSLGVPLRRGRPGPPSPRGLPGGVRRPEGLTAEWPTAGGLLANRNRASEGGEERQGSRGMNPRLRPRMRQEHRLPHEERREVSRRGLPAPGEVEDRDAAGRGA